MPLKVGAIIKLIEDDGWYLVAVRGSHRQYRHPTKQGRVTIPGKPSRELSHGPPEEHPEAGGTDEERSAVTSYVILIEATPDGGFGAWAPDLPGCVALGDSFEECLADMRSAVAFHLDGLREDGLPIPAPSTRAALVDAA